MKKIAFFSMLFCSMAVSAESPVDQGVYSLSNIASFTRKTNDVGDDWTSYSVSPSFMYFVKPNLAVGASLLYSKLDTDEFEVEMVGVGPAIRYYFSGESVFPFVSANYRKTNSDAESKSSVHPIVSDDTEWSVGFGAAIFLARNVALEPQVRYKKLERDYHGEWEFLTEDNKEEELSVLLGINVFIY